MITRICTICLDLFFFLGDESGIDGANIPRPFTCKRCKRKAKR